MKLNAEKKSCLDWRHQDSTSMHSHIEMGNLLQLHNEQQQNHWFPFPNAQYTCRQFVRVLKLGQGSMSINKTCSMNLFLACYLIKPIFFCSSSDACTFTISWWRIKWPKILISNFSPNRIFYWEEKKDRFKLN